MTQTNELLSRKLNREEKTNFQAKEHSKQLINSYKQAATDKRARESFRKEQDKSTELRMVENNQRIFELEMEQASQEKSRKKEILQSYLEEHNTQKMR